LEKADNSWHINRVLEHVRDNINISTKDSLGQYDGKQQMARFNEKAEKFAGQTNQVQLK
jgi:hypothetical protein